MSKARRTDSSDDLLELDLTFDASHERPRPSSKSNTRIHVVLPHVGFVHNRKTPRHALREVSDTPRIQMLVSYLRAAISQQESLAHVVVLPAGFLVSDEVEGRVRLATALKPFLNQPLLICGGTDAVDGSQCSWALDLSGTTPAWPVLVHKFKIDPDDIEDLVDDDPRLGKRSDPRTTVWHDIALASFCCADALVLRSEADTEALSGLSKTTPLRLIVCNSHYHGHRENSLYGVTQAGMIAGGLAMAAKLKPVVKDHPTVGVLSLYRDERPSDMKWVYENEHVKMTRHDDIVMNEKAGLPVRVALVDLQR